jgi:hypothetical protein
VDHATVVQIAGENYQLKGKRRASIMARPIATPPKKAKESMPLLPRAGPTAEAGGLTGTARSARR